MRRTRNYNKIIIIIIERTTTVEQESGGLDSKCFRFYCPPAEKTRMGNHHSLISFQWAWMYGVRVDFCSSADFPAVSVRQRSFENMNCGHYSAVWETAKTRHKTLERLREQQAWSTSPSRTLSLGRWSRGEEPAGHHPSGGADVFSCFSAHLVTSSKFRGWFPQHSQLKGLPCVLWWQFYYFLSDMSNLYQDKVLKIKESLFSEWEGCFQVSWVKVAFLNVSVGPVMNVLLPFVEWFFVLSWTWTHATLLPRCCVLIQYLQGNSALSHKNNEWSRLMSEYWRLFAHQWHLDKGGL